MRATQNLRLVISFSCSFFLIIISYDKTAQHEKKADPHKPFLEKMCTENIIYHITMRPEYHEGKYQSQRCQCVYHRRRPVFVFFLLFFVAKPNPCYAFIHIHSVHIHSDGQGFRPENPTRGIYNLNTLCF